MPRSSGFLILFLFCAILMPPMPAQAAQTILYTYDLTALAHGNVEDGAFRRHAWDELQVTASLQGIVNRNRPQLYLFLLGDGGRIDHYWLRRLQEHGEWLDKAPIITIPDTLSVVSHFRRAIRGVVVWDERVPATSNVASTIAGIKGLLPVRFDPAPGSLYWRLVLDRNGPRLPVSIRLLREDGSPLFTGVGLIPGTTSPSSGSAKCDAYLWAARNYLKKGLCDPTHLAYYPDAYWLRRNLKVPADRTLLSNHDYFIAHRSFFFDLSPWDDEAPDDDKMQPPGTDAKTLMTILRLAYEASGGRILHVGGFTPWDQKYTNFTGGRHGGVETEWRYAEILSCFNAYMDADAPGLNAMANASVYQHYPLAAHYRQPNLPTNDILRAKGYLDSHGQVAHKTFVAIYVGDYDSAAWLYQRLPDLWDDPVRGSIPLGWAFNPTIEQRFPVGLAYTRKTATPNDTFITGDSGAGYLNPGYLDGIRRWSNLPSGLAAWEAHSRHYYKRWDLRVTGFVIDGNAPPMDNAVKQAYARFSPGGVVAQKIPDEALVDGVPFLRMGPDLTASAEKNADTIAATASRNSPAFAIYRTILWGPGGHKQMFDRLKQIRPDIEIVEPNTLFLLMKHVLKGR